jgi:hypothetical protein
MASAFIVRHFQLFLTCLTFICSCFFYEERCFTRVNQASLKLKLTSLRYY